MSTPPINSRPATPVEEQSHFLRLPDDAILEIFKWIAAANDIKTLASLRLVCRRLQQFSDSDHVWNVVVQNITPRSVFIFNARDRYLVAMCPKTQPIRAGLWFNDQGTLQVAWIHDRTVRIAGIGNEEPMDIETGHEGPVRDLIYSPAGRKLVTRDTTWLKIWDLSGPALLWAQDEFMGGIASLAFDSTGRWLAIGRIEMCLLDVLDTTTYNYAAYCDFDGCGPVRALAFSPDGRWLVSGSDDSYIRFLAINNQYQCERTVRADYHIVSLAFSPDGRWLASGSDCIQIWDMNNFTCIANRGRLSLNSLFRTLAFSPDGRWLASSIRHVYIWDTTSNFKHEETAYTRIEETRCLCFSSDSSLLAFAGKTSTIRFWRPPPGQNQ